MKAKIIYRPVIRCPVCADESGFYVGHILNEDQEFGPWVCEECGAEIYGAIKNRKVEIQKISKRKKLR